MWTGANPQYQILNLWDTIDATSISVIKPSPPQAFATPPWLWDSQVPWFDFSNLKCRAHIWEGGVGPFWGNPQKCQNRQKLRNFYISPKVTQIETTPDGGQNNLKEHLGNVFELTGDICPIWEKSDFRTHKRKFSKIALGPDMGPGQIHGGVVWISMLGATEPSTLALFWDIIIFFPIPLRKNLEKFLSPDVGFRSRKKSAVNV